MNQIKAIETRYKGYRFRSRLEARWAVFFDTAEIKWQYEPEGYTLPDGTRYLPDFFLPELGRFIEVKPQLNDDRFSKPVYLAGKIAKNDWRGIARSKHGLNVVGPFFRSDDHGSCHGETTHGMGQSWCGEEAYDETHGEFMVAPSKSEVFNRSLSQIRKCDVVFAWINSDECFGTLVEIGYAKAIGKKIWIAAEAQTHERLVPFTIEYEQDFDCEFCGGDGLIETSHDETCRGTESWGRWARFYLCDCGSVAIDCRCGPVERKYRGDTWEMWFAQMCAEKFGVFNCVDDAIEKFFATGLKEDERKCQSLSKGTGKCSFIVRGVPCESDVETIWFKTCGEVFRSRGINGLSLMLPNTHPARISQSCEAAKSARFEFGDRTQ